LGGGVEESVRPGWEKGSGEDSFPHRLPIMKVWESMISVNG